MQIQVIPVSGAAPVQFAARELTRYLAAMGPGDDTAGSIRLGTYKDLGIDRPTGDSFDDEVYIAVEGGGGTVSGPNPRSVLLSVYRLLREAGCAFPFPGQEGEIIPRRPLGTLTVDLVETPSYRYRGMDTCGAMSEKNLLDILDWMPKMGMNTWLMETRDGIMNIANWYHHCHNPAVAPEFISRMMLEEIYRRAQAAAFERGLIYQTGGHGWTVEPFGVPVTGPDNTFFVFPTDSDLFSEMKPYLAMIDGKRMFRQKYGGSVPFDTNLCYSNPEVRRIMVADFVEYCRLHPQVDLVHFWLGDSLNTQCECDDCQKHLPTDLYVTLLNELDEALTAAGLGTRIVFLLYCELLWPPEKETLHNPDRFKLMFAPISRSYNEPFRMEKDLPPLPPYVRNRVPGPKSPAENLAFLQAWRRFYNADGFCFDYHMIWDHYNDPGYTQAARLLYEDTRNLRDIGLQGAVNCQAIRTFCPSGILKYVQTMTLWNRDTPFERMMDDYYGQLFGEAAGAVMGYLALLTDLFNPAWMRGALPRQDAGRAAALKKVAGAVKAFQPTVEAGLGEAAHPAQRTAWALLDFHGQYCARLAAGLGAIAGGDESRKAEDLEALLLWLGREEQRPEIQPYFDIYWCWETLSYRLFA